MLLLFLCLLHHTLSVLSEVKFHIYNIHLLQLLSSIFVSKLITAQKFPLEMNALYQIRLWTKVVRKKTIYIEILLFLFLSEISISMKCLKILCQIRSRYKSIWIHWSWLMPGEDLHLHLDAGLQGTAWLVSFFITPRHDNWTHLDTILTF